MAVSKFEPTLGRLQPCQPNRCVGRSFWVVCLGVCADTRTMPCVRLDRMLCPTWFVVNVRLYTSISMSRTLQVMWAKLSLAARARFLRTEEEHVDARWVADDEALPVGSSMMRRRGGGCGARRHRRLVRQPHGDEHQRRHRGASHRPHKRVMKEHEATCRAGCRCLCDLFN